MKTIGSIIGVLTLFGIFFGAYQYMESRYALSEEVKKIEQRLDYKIMVDQFKAVQQRIWTIEDRFQNKQMDQTTKDELRQLQTDRDQMKVKIDNMDKGASIEKK